jgi:hypothetical protein
MRIGFPDPRFVDPLDAVRSQHPDRDILRDYGLSVPAHIGIEALFPKRIVAEGVGVGWVQEPARAVPAIDGVCSDGKRQHWHSILLCEADRGRCRVYCRLQSAVEGWEGQLQINGVVRRGRLDSIVLKDGFYGQRPWHFLASRLRRSYNYPHHLRPYLSAGLWDDGEADAVVVKAHPGDLAQRRQRSREL